MYEIEFVEFPSFWAFGGKFKDKQNVLRYWEDNANGEDIMRGEMAVIHEDGTKEIIKSFDRRI